MSRLQNEDIRKELEVQSILDYIEQSQLHWYGHMKRMAIWQMEELCSNGLHRPHDHVSEMLDGHHQASRGETRNYHAGY